MAGTEPAIRPDEDRCAQFTTTHWSVVLAAGQSVSPHATASLENLCRTYWYPLYAHVRRRGFGPHDAQDITQAFFEELLQGSFFRAADPSKGRFRTFLLAALEHFLSKESRHRKALKRGGAYQFISIDDDSVENRFRLEPAHGESPERLFERGWALAVLDEAMNRLAGECSAPDRKAVFDQLSPLIGGDRGDSTRAQLAARLGLSENALNLTLLRLRRRYGELIRDVIAGTVADPKEVEEELRFLMQTVRQ